MRSQCIDLPKIQCHGCMQPMSSLSLWMSMLCPQVGTRLLITLSRQIFHTEIFLFKEWPPLIIFSLIPVKKMAFKYCPVQGGRGCQTWYTYLLGRFTTTFVWLSFEEYGMAHFGHQTFISNMWPVKIAKSCLKWLHYKNERFWHLYKNCQKCRQFGQNDSCHWLWKVAQKCNKSPNLVTLIAKYKGHDK